jgi:DNA-binding NarL/FixJ family response regulator
MKPSTVLIADEHAIVVEGLRRILDRPEFEVIGVARDGWPCYGPPTACDPL